MPELSWRNGQKYLTKVYPLDHGCRGLVHISRERTAASFNAFLGMLGERCIQQQLQLVASDIVASLPQGRATSS